MDKLMSLIFDIVIAVIIAFVAVLIYFGLRSETVISTMDAEITDSFLSEIKEKGSMTSTDYENYMYQLSLTGVLYEVLFEHKFNTLEPEYRMRTIEEIIAAQKAAYTGENIFHYKDVITQIPEVTDPIDNSGITMNTETNESILAGAIYTPSSGNVHTDDCYLGHKHKGSKTYTHSHSHTGSCTRFISKVTWPVSCASCGNSYQATTALYYWDPVVGRKLSYYYVLPTMQCIYCNNTSVNLGSVINDYSYSCDYNIDENGDGLNDEVPSEVAKNYSGHSNPQTADKATYISGCFTYHKAKPYTELFTYSQYNGLIINMDSAINSFFYSNVQEFCTLPGYFSCSWREDSGSVFSALSYVSQLQPDGQLLFYFSGYSDYVSSPYGSSDNPGFPTGITLSKLRDIFYSDYMYTFDRAIGHSYSVSSGSLSRAMGGTINSCNFDHSLGVNQWITNCGQIENATLMCPDKVISIVPTNATQSVYTNEPLITTVKATYQDGSTRVVLANTSFTTGSPVFNKIVTLTYIDTLGNTKTCTTTVNVVPRNKVCGNGHTYNLNTDGSDPGCVFCHVYVGNIRIIVPWVSTMTITIGSTLNDNGLKLLVTYKDGHTETLTEGYEDNLDKQYLGTKMVTIGYKGVTTGILVTTVCAKLTCDICGFLYELYPDFTNPGCPRCISKTPVFTGNVLQYDSINYTEDILEMLYKDDIYRFNKDDMLAVTIENKTSSQVRSLLRKIFPNMTDQWLHLESNETIQSR